MSRYKRYTKFKNPGSGHLDLTPYRGSNDGELVLDANVRWISESNEEIWSICLRYPQYEVSSLGRMRRRDSKRIIKSRPSAKGTIVVGVFYEDDRGRRVRGVAALGRLILNAFSQFIPYTFTNPVQYRDGNKRNLALSNIYFGSMSEVRVKSWGTGTAYKNRVLSDSFIRRGSRHKRWNGISDEICLEAIRLFRAAKNSKGQIAEKFGMRYHFLDQLLRGVNRKYLLAQVIEEEKNSKP